MYIKNEINREKLTFSLSFDDLEKLPENSVVYRESCDAFMIVTKWGYLSYINNSLRYRNKADFTPWTKKYEKFALINVEITVRNQHEN